VQCRRHGEADTALDLRRQGVRIDDQAGVDRAEDALDLESIPHVHQFGHFGHIGSKAATAPDVAIVRDAAIQTRCRRGRPIRRLGHGVEHPQSEWLGSQQMTTIEVLIGSDATCELRDKTLPEENRRGRADRPHEIHRDRQRGVDGLDREVRYPVALIVDAVDHALVPGPLRRLVEPTLAGSAEQGLTGDPSMHRQRKTGLVEYSAQACSGIRPENIMLGVLFTRADELDGTANCFRRLDGLHDIIGNDLAAETAA
jgi:hypothetical protein